MNIVFTEDALKKINKENIKNVIFKITKYGCSGYAFILDEYKDKDKNIDGFLNVSGINVYYDKYTLDKLKDTETVVDFKNTGFSSMFSFSNSRAKEACGCGDSVYLEGEDD